MRNSQQAVWNAREPDHVGLAHDRWPPAGDREADQWLARLSDVTVSPDYRHFFQRWRSSFGPDTRIRRVELRSRLLIGHGNPGGHQIGLTVHHTWGVPVIPGSALKGLLAHRLDILYGPGDSPEPDDDERARWRGVRWNGPTIAHGPGDYHRALFGAPDAGDDAELRALGRNAGATAGLIHFHDALYIPGSVADERPFARDVLTVHHKPYYDRQGAERPNDWEHPIPIGFLTVRPTAQFLLAVTGRPGAAEWTALATQQLLAALDNWGIGGKTSLGYGRLAEVDEPPSRAAPQPASPDPRPPAPEKRPTSPTLEEFIAFLKSNMTHEERMRRIIPEWRDKLVGLHPDERRIAATRTRKQARDRPIPPDVSELLGDSSND